MPSAKLESLKRYALAASRFPTRAAIVRPPKRDRKRPGDAASDGVPVDPNRPGSLDGGAAAALTFDE